MTKKPVKKAPAKKPAPAKRPVAKKAKPATKPVAKAPVKERTDWEAVERDYRASKMTLREMAEKHGTSAGRICQVAKEKGWVRGDLLDVVRQATSALLIAEHVEGEVNKAKQGLNETVLAQAEMNKQVILRHRTDLGRARTVAMDMLEELATTTTKAEQLEEFFEKVTEDMDKASLALAQQRFREFMKLHNRVGSVHRLTDALNKLQTLERKAYDLDDQSKGGSTGYEDALEDVYSEIAGK